MLSKLLRQENQKKPSYDRDVDTLRKLVLSDMALDQKAIAYDHFFGTALKNALDIYARYKTIFIKEQPADYCETYLFNLLCEISLREHNHFHFHAIANKHYQLQFDRALKPLTLNNLALYPQPPQPSPTPTPTPESPEKSGSNHLIITTYTPDGRQVLTKQEIAAKESPLLLFAKESLQNKRAADPMKNTVTRAKSLGALDKQSTDSLVIIKSPTNRPYSTSL